MIRFRRHSTRQYHPEKRFIPVAVRRTLMFRHAQNMRMHRKMKHLRGIPNPLRWHVHHRAPHYWVRHTQPTTDRQWSTYEMRREWWGQ